MFDYEILEMLLFSANSRSDMRDLAKILIKKFKSLKLAIYASSEQLKEIPEVTESTIFTLKLIQHSFELILQEKFSNQNIQECWDYILDYLLFAMGHEEIENVRVFFINKKNILIKNEAVQKGTVDQTAIYTREIVKRAISLNASYLILAHNHPSGNPTPSKQDIFITKQLQAALKEVNIILHDHFIVADRGIYSMKQHYLL